MLETPPRSREIDGNAVATIVPSIPDIIIPTWSPMKTTTNPRAVESVAVGTGFLMAAGIFLIASGCQSAARDGRRHMATQVGLDHGAVVEAAGALVDESGVEALTLAGLAASLGIRSQSLYAHVDGLDGLLRDLALDSVRKLGDELRSSVIGRSGRDALEAIAEAYWDFARAHPGRYASTIRDPGEDEELRDANLRAAEALTRV